MLDLERIGGPYASVFDVGGSVGGFAKACYMRWPDAKIRSFEPLRDAAQANQDKAQGRWQVSWLALGARHDRAIINRSLTQPTASTMKTPGPMRVAMGKRDAYRREPVTVCPLDDWFEELEQPCLVKIDVEGYEWEVLQGAPAVLSNAETVIVEVQNDPTIFEGSVAVDELDGLLNYHRLRFSGLADAFLHPQTGAVLQYDGIWRRL